MHNPATMPAARTGQIFSHFIVSRASVTWPVNSLAQMYSDALPNVLATMRASMA